MKSLVESLDQHETVGDLGKFIEENVRNEHEIDDFMDSEYKSFQAMENRMIFQHDRELVNEQIDEEDELTESISISNFIYSVYTKL